jgi:hypothetical protein
MSPSSPCAVRTDSGFSEKPGRPEEILELAGLACSRSDGLSDQVHTLPSGLPLLVYLALCWEMGTTIVWCVQE